MPNFQFRLSASSTGGLFKCIVTKKSSYMFFICYTLNYDCQRRNLNLYASLTLICKAVIPFLRWVFVQTLEVGTFVRLVNSWVLEIRGY